MKTTKIKIEFILNKDGSSEVNLKMDQHHSVMEVMQALTTAKDSVEKVVKTVSVKEIKSEEGITPWLKNTTMEELYKINNRLAKK